MLGACVHVQGVYRVNATVAWQLGDGLAGKRSQQVHARVIRLVRRLCPRSGGLTGQRGSVRQCADILAGLRPKRVPARVTPPFSSSFPGSEETRVLYWLVWQAHGRNKSRRQVIGIRSGLVSGLGCFARSFRSFLLLNCRLAGRTGPCDSMSGFHVRASGASRL